MTHVRYKHMIIELDDNKKAVDTKVFPSNNHAKRYNRTMLGGKAQEVFRRPKDGEFKTQNNARCDRG